MSESEMQAQRRDLFDNLTYVDQRDIRRWKFSRRCVDPYDYEGAGYTAPDHQVDQFMHEQLDAFDRGEEL